MAEKSGNAVPSPALREAVERAADEFWVCTDLALSVAAASRRGDKERVRQIIRDTVVPHVARVVAAAEAERDELRAKVNRLIRAMDQCGNL